MAPLPRAWGIAPLWRAPNSPGATISPEGQGATRCGHDAGLDGEGNTGAANSPTAAGDPRRARSLALDPTSSDPPPELPEAGTIAALRDQRLRFTGVETVVSAPVALRAADADEVAPRGARVAAQQAPIPGETLAPCLSPALPGQDRGPTAGHVEDLDTHGSRAERVNAICAPAAVGTTATAPRLSAAAPRAAGGDHAAGEGGEVHTASAALSSLSRPSRRSPPARS